MKGFWRAVALFCFWLAAQTVFAGVPPLPEGALTRWAIQEPAEIVGYLLFDPATVEDRLPPALRFITLEELASGGVSWAREYVASHPAQCGWGISFLEIVRTGTFTIDGRSPDWPRDGAMALWAARVAPVDPEADLGPGRPLLVLDFWMPDGPYAAFMRERGHCAAYGDVKLFREPEGRWCGSLRADGLRALAQCTPAGPVSGGAASAGMQVLFPPLTSGPCDVVRVAFAGHREQGCGEASSWTLQGAHPLARGVMLEPSVFEWGYDLIGGAYPW